MHIYRYSNHRWYNLCLYLTCLRTTPLIVIVCFHKKKRTNTYQNYLPFLSLYETNLLHLTHFYDLIFYAVCTHSNYKLVSNRNSQVKCNYIIENLVGDSKFKFKASTKIHPSLTLALVIFDYIGAYSNGRKLILFLYRFYFLVY